MMKDFKENSSKNNDKHSKNLDKLNSKLISSKKSNQQVQDIENEIFNHRLASQLKPIQVNLLGSVINRITNLKKQSIYNPYQFIAKAVVENLEYDKLFCPFERRISSICWHPKRSSLALGGKGGEIGYVKHINEPVEDRIIQDFVLLHDRIGPEGEMKDIKFDKLNDNLFFSLSIQGQLLKSDLNHFSQSIIRPLCLGNLWFYSLEIDSHQKLFYIGDNKGCLNLIFESFSIKQVTIKAHKGKINCIDMHPRNSNLMATTSTGDNSVRIWDVRKLEENNPLQILNHDKPVNSAYFSSTNGGTILTTDQGSQIRVYCSTNFELERIISHPHRQFQHITPIRAFWHPLADIIIVGRYPDPKYLPDDKRTVDFINPHNGNIIHQLHSPNALCLHNKFNYTGDILASMQSTNILIWKPKSNIIKELSNKRSMSRRLSDDDDEDNNDDDDDDKDIVKKNTPKIFKKPKKCTSSKKLSSYF